MIIAISGLPGTGKTTFADALTYRLEAKHVNADRTRRLIGKEGDFSTNAKVKVYGELFKQVEDLVQVGHTVIVDSTFYLQDFRQDLENIGMKFGQPVIWIQLLAGEEVVKTRYERIREDSDADFESYKMVKELYQPMTGDFLSLDSDQMVVKDMIYQAVSYIQTKQIDYLSLVER